MFFDGCVRELATIPLPVVAEFRAVVDRLRGHFKQRSLMIMKSVSVMKALSPTDIDALDEDTEEELWDAMAKLRKHVPTDDERFLYADVSSLPAGASIDLHVDFTLMHALSRRIHIPLMTNEHVHMGFINSTGGFEKHHLEVGKIYEVNNCIPHAVRNAGDATRWHVLFDVAKKDDAHFLEGREVLTTVSPIINRILSPIVTAKMHHALSK